MSPTVEKQAERKQADRRIGRTAKALLKCQGKTARWLSDEIGEPETTTSKLLRGTQAWHPLQLRDAARALNVEVDVLYEDAADALRQINYPAEMIPGLLAAVDAPRGRTSSPTEPVGRARHAGTDDQAKPDITCFTLPAGDRVAKKAA